MRATRGSVAASRVPSITVAAWSTLAVIVRKASRCAPRSGNSPPPSSRMGQAGFTVKPLMIASMSGPSACALSAKAVTVS